MKLQVVTFERTKRPRLCPGPELLQVSPQLQSPILGPQSIGGTTGFTRVGSDDAQHNASQSHTGTAHSNDDATHTADVDISSNMPQVDSVANHSDSAQLNGRQSNPGQSHCSAILQAESNAASGTHTTAANISRNVSEPSPRCRLDQLDPVRLNAGGQLNRASIELQEPQVLQEPPNALDVSNTTTSDLFSNVSQPPSNADQSNVDQSTAGQSLLHEQSSAPASPPEAATKELVVPLQNPHEKKFQCRIESSCRLIVGVQCRSTCKFCSNEQVQSAFRSAMYIGNQCIIRAKASTATVMGRYICLVCSPQSSNSATSIGNMWSHVLGEKHYCQVLGALGHDASQVDTKSAFRAWMSFMGTKPKAQATADKKRLLQPTANQPRFTQTAPTPAPVPMAPIARAPTEGPTSAPYVSTATAPAPALPRNTSNVGLLVPLAAPVTISQGAPQTC